MKKFHSVYNIFFTCVMVIIGTPADSSGQLKEKAYNNNDTTTTVASEMDSTTLALQGYRPVPRTQRYILIDYKHEGKGVLPEEQEKWANNLYQLLDKTYRVKLTSNNNTLQNKRKNILAYSREATGLIKNVYTILVQSVPADQISLRPVPLLDEIWPNGLQPTDNSKGLYGATIVIHLYKFPNL